MIELIKTKSELKSDDFDHPKWLFPYGDYSYLHDNFGEVKRLLEEEDYNILPYFYWGDHPYDALIDAGIDLFRLQKKVKNTCPYTRMKYWAVVPFAVITKNNHNYRDVLKTWEKCAEDFDWNRHCYGNWVETDPDEHMNKICRVLLGTGYTEMCSKWDGSSVTEWTILHLKNGDYILAYRWVWLNK